MSRRPGWLPLAAFVTAGVALYARALSIQRYGDDLGFVLPTPIHPLFHFTAPHPFQFWYRPLEAMVMACAQNVWGLAVWPLHAVALGLHLTLALTVRALGRDLGLSDAAAWLAALWLLFAQVAVMAVASGDTLSQQLAALGVTVAGWQTQRYVRDGHRRALLWAGLAAAVALWGKESGLAVVPVVGVIALAHGRSATAAPRAWASVALVLGLAVLYGLCRARVVSSLPQLGTSGYGFQLGLNIPLNLANLWGACLSPVSTVAMVRWMQLGPAWAFGLSLLPATAMLAGMAGVWHHRRAALAILAALATVSLLPTALLHHVSELYAYQALPWVALLVGGMLAALPTRWRLGLVLVLLVAHGAAVQGKLTAMRANGERTASYLAELQPLLPTVPAGGRVCLVDGRGGRWRYAVFVLPGFRVFEYALDGLPIVLGRRDLQFELRGAGDVPPPAPGQLVVTLSADERRLEVLRPVEGDLDP